MEEKKPASKQRPKMKLATKIRLGVVATLVLVCLLLLSPIFSIRHIEVKTEDAELMGSITKQLEGAQGQNGFLYVAKNVNGLDNIGSMLALRAKNMEDVLLFDRPELKNMQVSYVFPNTLTVQFARRTPSYLIVSSGVYVCADEEGFVLSVHTDSTERDLPVVRGIDLPSYKIGQTISTGNENQMKALNALFYEITLCDAQEDDYKLSAHIEIADVSEYNEIWLFVDENLSVNLGDTDNIEYKIPALKEILQTEEMQGKKGLIDFTVSEQPVFLAENG